MTKLLNILFLIPAIGIFLPVASGQIPPGYYDNAAGLSGEPLKTALHFIIDNHTSISYTAVENALKDLDEDPNNSNNVILLYKRTSQSKASFGGGINDWNREHLWPHSHGDFGTSAPEGTDLFHMRPTDASVNSDRGDKDFDNCQSGGTQHSEATQCYYTTNAWEPPDIVKGDIARSVFYMEVRYEGDSGEADLEIEDFYTSPSGSPGYLGKLSTLMLWHEDDPVDAEEQARNNTIYNNYQGNRNPFIDHPEYVGLIWGDGFAPEPTNHASGFSAHTITLNWTDASGGVLPDAYLVRMGDTGFENIAVPVDGMPVADNFWNTNVSYGTATCTFGGLTENTVYYFKIYGYTGSGAAIDYKTDGTVQQISIEAK
ncbi:MAG: endonuclease [Bacteroidales bacterium]|nr:endonuclease [Bacteroidales bacterium]